MKSLMAAILALSCAVAFALEPYKRLPPAEELKAAIDREGAKTVLWQGLWSGDGGKVFDSLTGQIRSGDAQWLRLAARLRAVSDAAASELLDGAMSDALPRAPGRVLRVITLSDDPGGFSLGSICSGRFLVREGDAPETVLRWYENSERALLAFRAAEVEAKRTACLAEVKRRHHLLLTSPDAGR